MINLPEVTLVLVDCKNYGQALNSIRQSLKHIKPARTIFITDIEFDPKDDRIEVMKIDKITSIEQYSRFIVKELHRYFDTEYVLITQWDGYVLSGDAWSEDFMKYDVVGATWQYRDGRNVGQGGFCLHSKRLHEILYKDDFISITFPDDEIIARLYRDYLEYKYHIKYAPEEVANRFSFELNEPTQHTFGFHSFFHKPFKDHVVIKREGACGDVVMVEPLIQYYHDKGYQVVLDTQPQFMSLFFQHPFPVKHISQMNKAINPIKTIYLDMAYELYPQTPVLEAYCKKAEIEIPLRNSRLNVYADQKMFKKLAIIHADTTSIPHRDINHLNWELVVEHLKSEGYTVLQVGKRMDKEVATYINTFTLEFLMFVLKGADVFIGLDSGNAQIAVALGVPSIIMAGSVDLRKRYSDFTNIIPIQGKCEKEETAFCYHNVISDKGQDCIYNKELPPCTRYQAVDIINAINNLNVGSR